MGCLLFCFAAPIEAPVLVKAVNTSSTSIILKWTEISPENYGGILLGYRIYYRPADTKKKTKVIELSTTTFTYHLTDLFLWWSYEIRVGAYNRVGIGVTTNVTVQTDEDRK